jgi:hypothetical protein
MEELKKTFPADVDYSIPFESVSVVEVSIEEVIETLVIALLLVILVVFLFLQSWRATLIPLLAIPVSSHRHVHLFHSPGLYHQHPHAVWLRAGHRHRGGRRHRGGGSRAALHGQRKAIAAGSHG